MGQSGGAVKRRVVEERQPGKPESTLLATLTFSW